MNIVVSNDHAGFLLKAQVIAFIESLGHRVIDVGSPDDQPVDFPVMTKRLTEVIQNGEADRGVLVCGTGVGAAIAANKIAGIRASVIHDVFSAAQCVEHDDVNVACLGAWIVGAAVAERNLAFLSARFRSEDPDFVRRVAQLAEFDGARAHTPDLPADDTSSN